VSQAVSIIARYGRSFRLAGRLLPGATFQDAAELYAFCRAVDDIADDAQDPAAVRDALLCVRRALLAGDRTQPLAARCLALHQKHGMDPHAATALLDTLLGDAGPVRMEDEAALLRYAYGVAGTVGLMMCGILGAHDARAAPHAIDLGIAMQLTNIARDVVEDAARGRLYLPASWLPRGLGPDRIATAPDAVFAAVQMVLERAGRRYRSAEAGISYLPARVRPSIRAAGALYEEIGRRILRSGPGYLLAGRCVVPPERRLWLVARSLWANVPSAPHDRTLHAALLGAPGAHA
jgi:phytoene synthase